ncbi:hypothetical protein LzC2_30350 [Planctomycetes bacterium LzC2]|uniref:Uncharacterized protein n=1 Tax=Alienimonas chondri TaxID=2681879 RepID=A0ABX1VFR3_9PLAN|nr:hypothetical protein [Alienimonas chondri]
MSRGEIVLLQGRLHLRASLAERLSFDDGGGGRFQRRGDLPRLVGRAGGFGIRVATVQFGGVLDRRQQIPRAAVLRLAGGAQRRSAGERGEFRVARFVVLQIAVLPVERFDGLHPFRPVAGGAVDRPFDVRDSAFLSHRAGEGVRGMFDQETVVEFQRRGVLAALAFGDSFLIEPLGLFPSGEEREGERSERQDRGGADQADHQRAFEDRLLARPSRRAGELRQRGELPAGGQQDRLFPAVGAVVCGVAGLRRFAPVAGGLRRGVRRVLVGGELRSFAGLIRGEGRQGAQIVPAVVVGERVVVLGVVEDRRLCRGTDVALRRCGRLLPRGGLVRGLRGFLRGAL